MVSIGEDGLEHVQVVEGAREAFCVFEHIYFARPDSRMGGTRAAGARGRMGEILAREAPADADLVIPVPDSGNPAARGYARASGPATGRRLRQEPLRRAHVHPARPGAAQARPAPEVQPDPGGRRRQARRRRRRLDRARQHDPSDRRMLRDAGAAEIHMRVSAPPIKHPCHYGIDMSTREEMIAHGRTVDRGRRRARLRLARLPLARGRLRGDRRPRAAPLRRLLHAASTRSRGPRQRERQVRARAAGA